jgi:lipopolysaccharide transport system permease protein
LTQRLDIQEIVIRAGSPTGQYWRDVWRFRELLLLLVWRDVLVRYKQTAFGIAWAVVRPFVTMVVFTIVFGRLANLPSHDVPYPLLVFAGMLCWQFFSATFADASNSVTSSANMISKVYFPRIIVPLSSMFAGMVDLSLTGVLFIILAAWYGYWPDWHVVALPAFVVLLFLCVFASSIWISALNVAYRDFRYVVPFVIQLGAYISPVGFSSNVVPEQWRLLYSLNPMVGIIDGFRWCLLRGSVPLDATSLALSIVITLVLLVPGIAFFQHKERHFADII